MNTEYRDKFIQQWCKYFKKAELLITFEHVDSYSYTEPLLSEEGFRCVMA